VQHHLAAEVVAHLDGFLVGEAGVVDVVVALGLEEEVARLPPPPAPIAKK